MGTVHVIGLGSGNIESLNAEVQHLLTSARHLVLRDTSHPIADELRGRGVSFRDCPATLPCATVSAPADPEAAGPARRLADSLRCMADEHGEVVYAVAFSRPLLDPVVPLLCRMRELTVTIHPGPGAEKDAGPGGAATEQESELRPAAAVNERYAGAGLAGEKPVQAGASFEQLVRIMRRLRGPDGCLWDREQTHSSLARHLIEEAYEVVDSIERGGDEDLAEELGDLLLQVVFHAQVAADEGRFGIVEVLEGIIAKLVRRHPHIFADVEVATSADVSVNWERIKREEKGLDDSALAGVLPSLPALMYAEKLQAKAARVGFDWDEYRQVIAKVQEELREVAEAKEGTGDVEAEIGDVLFAVVNLSRFLGIDCETALRGVCARFIARFETMERLAAERGVVFADLSLLDKESLWQEAKGETRE